MYYSKTQTQGMNIPPNYSGNIFRTDEQVYEQDNRFEEAQDSEMQMSKNDEKGEKSSAVPFLSHILSNISIEDFLILGLIIVIHQENPNDTTLLLLLVLLLAK